MEADIFHPPQRVQQEKPQLIAAGKGFRQVFVHSGGLGSFLESFRSRAHAECWESYTPPILSLTLSNDDPQRFIDARGECKGIILPNVKGFPAQCHHRAAVHSGSFQSLIGNAFDF